ncbi:MAG: glycosyltransferase family 2 protein, partial [Parabacteroides sp.]|nr:glycosyltransferase family 2 protein [Parabacteroides sp.]
MKKLSIIVPCYNEEAVLAESYRRTKLVVSKLPYPAEIIYINDGSRDATRSILDAISVSDPDIKVIHFSRNFGHQPAVTAGIHYCESELAIILDADMQDPPELIPDILRLQEEEEANVVFCVRKSREGENNFKLLTSRMFYRFLNHMSEVAFPVDTGDFRLIDRKVMNEFDRFKEHGKYIRGLI